MFALTNGSAVRLDLEISRTVQSGGVVRGDGDSSWPPVPCRKFTDEGSPVKISYCKYEAIRGAEVIAWAINHLLVECREDRYVYE